MSIGVPIKVLHEAEGHIVTCETITGEVYRGKLIEAEDNMNCQMTQITVTYRDGRVAQLENVYIRGSKIRFLILPDMLKNAPMFKNRPRPERPVAANRPFCEHKVTGFSILTVLPFCRFSILKLPFCYQVF